MPVGQSTALVEMKYPACPQQKQIQGPKSLPPEYSVRMLHLGLEVWFYLETANELAAAAKARDIYHSLVAAGWIATLE